MRLSIQRNGLDKGPTEKHFCKSCSFAAAVSQVNCRSKTRLSRDPRLFCGCRAQVVGAYVCVVLSSSVLYLTAEQPLADADACDTQSLLGMRAKSEASGLRI